MIRPVRILFDPGAPAPLRGHLSGHEITTAYERGWGTLQNGELLPAPESAGFEANITTDQNLRYRQNLAERQLAIVVLLTTGWPPIRPHASSVARAVAQLSVGAYFEPPFPPAAP